MNTETRTSKKRKRNRSLVTNVRNCTKRSNMERGFQLDGETYQYFKEILKTYATNASNDEDKVVFANNVFRQMENNEMNYACSQLGSCVIELLLPAANKQIIDQFVAKLLPELRKFCSDPFGSHIIEALVKVCCTRSIDEEIKVNERESYKEYALKINKFLFNNLQDCVWDVYANPTIRSILKSFAFLPDKVKKVEETIVIPDEYSSAIIDYANTIIHWPQFKDMAYADLTSGLIQVLLRCLARIDPKLLKMFVKKLRTESFLPQSNGVSDVYTSKAAIMLLETCLAVAPASMYTKFYHNCLHGQVEAIINVENVHFTLQKWVEKCQNEGEFLAIFDEISKHWEQLVTKGHLNVLVAIGQACLRLHAKQNEFLKLIMAQLNCAQPHENRNFLMHTLTTMTKYQSDSDADEVAKKQLNYHGVHIAEALFHFERPKWIVRSILHMSVEQLKRICMDRIGSHIINAFVSSPFVSENKKRALAEKMQGTYQALAASKSGSRAFEALWHATDDQWKLTIMEEIGNKSQIWCNTVGGRVIAAKVNLPLYVKDKHKWSNALKRGGGNLEKSS